MLDAQHIVLTGRGDARRICRFRCLQGSLEVSRNKKNRSLSRREIGRLCKFTRAARIRAPSMTATPPAAPAHGKMMREEKLAKALAQQRTKLTSRLGATEPVLIALRHSTIHCALRYARGVVV